MKILPNKTVKEKNVTNRSCQGQSQEYDEHKQYGGHHLDHGHDQDYPYQSRQREKCH